MAESLASSVDVSRAEAATVIELTVGRHHRSLRWPDAAPSEEHSSLDRGDRQFDVVGLGGHWHSGELGVLHLANRVDRELIEFRRIVAAHKDEGFRQGAGENGERETDLVELSAGWRFVVGLLLIFCHVALRFAVRLVSAPAESEAA